MLGSFKVKLVGTFVALSLVPLAAAFWGFTAVSERSITSGADGRLEAGLSAAVAALADERRRVEATAERIGRSAGLQAAIAARDRAALERLLPSNVRIEASDGLAVGTAPALAAESTISLVGPGTRSARLIAFVPLTASTVRRLHARSGLAAPDELVVVRRNERVVASSSVDLRGEARLAPGRVSTTEIGGESYRSVGTLVAPEERAVLAAVTPSSAIAVEQRSILARLVIGLVGSLLLIAVLAYVAGRSIVGALARLAAAADSIAAGRLGERVSVKGRDEFAALGRAFNEMAEQLEARLDELEDERRRLREANVRFGDALAAALDPEQLRRVIVESAVEATQADGGAVIAEDGSVVEAGVVDSGGTRLDFELTAGRRSYGRLVLHGDDFDVEERMTAASLAGQAVVALENARLHRLAERHALLDSLTGLSNRRHADQTLRDELVRAERLGGPVGLILADVDDFKAVNDRHGHPTGDVVLRDVAATMRETIREIDTAARWGGEEFAVVLPGTDLEGAAQVAERIRVALGEREILSVDGEPLRVTASFGAAASTPTTTAEQLVEAADEALYRAKRAGKNRVFAGLEPVPRR